MKGGENIRKNPCFWARICKSLKDFFKSIKGLAGKSDDDLEKEVERGLERLWIGESDGEFLELKSNLVGILSTREDAEKFLDWTKKYNSALEGKIKSRVKDLKSRIKEEEKKQIIPTIKQALDDNILGISDEVAIKIIECLQHEKADLQTLKRKLDFDNGEIESGVDWLSTLGMIEEIKHPGGVAYRISNFGARILEENSIDNQSISWGKQISYIACAATKDKRDAERLINRLFGQWGKKHRETFEKLDKEFGKSLKKMSKVFWEKMEEGHSKHVGIKISNHEAGGMLLMLRLSSLRLEDRIPKKQRAISNRILDKSGMRETVTSQA